MGFFWALGGQYNVAVCLECPYAMKNRLASAEQRGLYEFSRDLGRAGLQIAETHGTNSDKWSLIRICC